MAKQVEHEMESRRFIEGYTGILQSWCPGDAESNGNEHFA